MPGIVRMRLPSACGEESSLFDSRCSPFARALAHVTGRCWWRWPLSLALVFLTGTAAPTVPPSARSIFQLHHTAWTAENGAPAGVESLAQTTDGYLWIGSNTGLYRFDGIHFERYRAFAGEPLLDQSISRVWAPRTGGLWIHYSHSGASFLDHGHLTHYRDQDGLGSGTIFQFKQADDGTLWAAKQDGLAKFDGKSWRIVNAEVGLPEEFIYGVLIARDGSIWVSIHTSVYVLHPHAKVFEATGIRADVPTLAQAPDGTIWLGDRNNGLRPLAPSPEKV